jgi:hypothetical protein
MIDLLADQLSISKKDAMKKVLRGFIEKEGIDTTIKIPMRDLAVELLGCHGLVVHLLIPPTPPKSQDIPTKPTIQEKSIVDKEQTPVKQLTDYEMMLNELENNLKSGDFEGADLVSKKIIKTKTGYKIIDTKEKANTIPIDVLRDLKEKWQLSSVDVLTRDWVKEGGSGFTTYMGFLSTTTYMQYIFTRID